MERVMPMMKMGWGLGREDEDEEGEREEGRPEKGGKPGGARKEGRSGANAREKMYMRMRTKVSSPTYSHSPLRLYVMVGTHQGCFLS